MVYFSEVSFYFINQYIDISSVMFLIVGLRQYRGVSCRIIVLVKFYMCVHLDDYKTYCTHVHS